MTRLFPSFSPHPLQTILMRTQNERPIVALIAIGVVVLVFGFLLTVIPFDIATGSPDAADGSGTFSQER
jgi:hypothetical protein